MRRALMRVHIATDGAGMMLFTKKGIGVMKADIERNGYDGIGKPEPLKGDLSGWWSRRIDDINRIVYQVKEGGVIEIAQCQGHYRA